MSVKTYLWIVDKKGKAAYTFWTTLMLYLFPNVTVENKKNNSELVKAVCSLTDSDNRYIILYDNSFDNPQLYRERRYLKKTAEQRKNIFLVDFICFEYILLEFDKLIEWIFAPGDDLLEKRIAAIAARNKLVKVLRSGELDYKAIQGLKSLREKLGNAGSDPVASG